MPTSSEGDNYPPLCERCGGSTHQIGVSRSLLVYFRCQGCGRIATAAHHDSEVVSDLTNALQAALLLSVELEAKAMGQFDDVGRLQDVLRRAVVAARKLRLP